MSEEIARLGIAIEYAQAKQAIEELRRLGGEARKTESATEKLKNETKKYDDAQKKANASASSGSGALARLGAMAAGVARNLAAGAAASAGIAASFAAYGTIRVGSGFEQQMSSVLAITQTTKDLFEELTKQARELGATTVFSAKEAAEGMEFLARAGFKANQIMGALPGTLNLASAGALGLGEAADIASNVLTGFGLAAEEANRVSDVLAKAAASSNTNVQQLGDAMKYVAPVAAGLGVSLEEATAAVGKLSDAGLQASMAGTGLRRVITDLATPSKALREFMGDATLATDGFIGVMEKLATTTIGTEEALEIFGDRGGPAFSILIEQFRNLDKDGVSSIEKLNAALVAANGFAQDTANTMTDNLSGSVKSMNSAIEELLITASDQGGVLKALRSLVDQVTIILRSDAAKDFATAFGEAMSTAINFAGGLLAIVRDINSELEKYSFNAPKLQVLPGIPLTSLTVGGKRDDNGALIEGTGFKPFGFLDAFNPSKAAAKIVERGEAEAVLQKATKNLEEQRIKQEEQIKGYLSDREKLFEQIETLDGKFISRFDMIAETTIAPEYLDDFNKLNSLAKEYAEKFSMATGAAKGFADANDKINESIGSVERSLRDKIGEAKNLSGSASLGETEFQIAQTVERMYAKAQSAGEKISRETIDGLVRELDKIEAANERAIDESEFQRSMKMQREALEGFSEAAANGEQAMLVFARAQDIAKERGTAVTEQIIRQAEEIEKLNGSQKTIDTVSATEREIKGVLALGDALRVSAREYEIIQQKQKLLADNPYWDEAVASSRAVAEALVGIARDSAIFEENAARLAEFDFDPFTEFGQNAADAIVDFYVDFRQRGFEAVKDLGSNFKDVFKRLANDIFANLVLKPLLEPIVGIFQGINGQKEITRETLSKNFETAIKNQTTALLSGMDSAAQTVAGGASGDGQPANDNATQAVGAWDRLKNFWGTNDQQGEIGKRYEEMFNGIGDIVGKISSGLGDTVKNLSKDLSKFAAGATAGFAGYSAGSGAADLFNGEQGETGGKVGGAVGGGVGFAIGGPLGAFVGSAIGSFFGDLFGGLFGRKTATGVLDLASGDISGKDSKKDSRNEARDAVLVGVQNSIDALTQILGGRISGGYSTEINVGKSNTRVELLTATGAVAAKGEVKNDDIEGAVALALGQILDKGVLKGTDEFLTRVATTFLKVDRPVEDTLQSVSDLAAIMEFTKEPTGEFAKILQEVSDIFGDGALAAGKYGTAVRELAELQLEVIQSVAGKFDRTIQDQIRAIEAPQAQSVIELLREQNTRLTEAKAINDALSAAQEAINTAPNNPESPRQNFGQYLYGYNSIRGDGGFSNYDDLENAWASFFGVSEDATASLLNAAATTEDVARLTEEAQQRLNDVLRLNTLEFTDLVAQLASSPEELAAAVEAFKSFYAEIAESVTDTSGIEQAFANAVTGFAQTIDEQVAKDIQAFESPTYSRFQELLAKQEQLVKSTIAVGANLNQVQLRNSLDIQNFFSSLSDDQKAELGDYMGLVEDSGGRIAVVMAQLADNMDRYVSNMEEQRDELQRSGEEFKRFADTIRGSLDTINERYGSGTPEQKLEELQLKFFDLVTQARSGNAEAFSQVGSLGVDIVDRARESYGSTTQFAVIRDTITGALGSLEGMANEQATSLLLQAEQIDAEYEVLLDIREVLKDPQGTDILRDILDSGRIQNEITRELITELIGLREAQDASYEQLQQQLLNELLTLQQAAEAQYQAAAQTIGSFALAPANQNVNTGGTDPAILENMNQMSEGVQQAFNTLNDKTDDQIIVLQDIKKSMDNVATEINRDRVNRALV